MKRSFQTLSCLLLVIALAGICSASPRPAPTWECNDLNGDPHRLEDWRGKWVLLKLGRTDCPDCAREFQEMVRVKDSIEALDVEVLDIFLRQDRYTVKKYLQKKRKNTDYHPTILYDWTGRIVRDYGISIIPHLVLVNPDGNIVWEARYLPGPELVTVLESHVGSDVAKDP